MVGTPLIVTTFADHTALTPSGRPVAAPIPEIPVVEWVIFVRSLLIFNVGVEEVGVTEVQAQCFAGEFERGCSSGGGFNAVHAAFRRSVSRRFERGSSSGGNCGDSKSYGQDLILNTPNGGTYGFTYLIR